MRIECYAHATSAAEVQIASFRGDSGTTEYHLIVRPTVQGPFGAQLDWLHQAYREALAAVNLDPRTALLRRFFCTDLSNQAAALAVRPFANPETAEDPCAVSWVGMPPAPPASVTMWAYHVSDPVGPLVKSREPATLVWQRHGLAHRWTTGLAHPSGATAYDQTRACFQQYDALLRKWNMSWSADVLRTWLFVRNINANYEGVVAARREFLGEHGLTPETHFIASTGIEGAGVDPVTMVTLDAYAIQGVRPAQISFLKAPDHLGPTHLYGVTFERGVAIAYRDRRHVIISGTASIDPDGRVVHVGNLAGQLDRTLTNIAALLRAAGATLYDVGVFIVYVREPGDLPFVRQWRHAHCGATPTAVLIAPICRPEWLVEIEAMAVVPAANTALPAC